MADKTVNINIKYNVDASQVLKAEAASRAAQGATDRLRKSVEDYAKASANAAKTAQDSFKKIQGDTESLTGSVNSLVGAVKTVLTAGLVRWAVESSLEMARLAGNVEAVSNAFNKQIPNATGLLNDLRKATHGAVTDLELMQKTLQAKNFGLAVESLPKLLEFAAIRAQQTGVSVDYLVNSIVTGIGRKSILILDNLGISATRLKEEFGGASLAAQSVADVTQAVGRIAEEELGKMGGFAENSANDVDQLSVSWTKLRENIAKFFSSGAIPQFLKEYVDSFSALAEAVNRGISVTEVFSEKMREQQAQISANEFIQRRFTESKEENIKILQEEIAELTKGLGVYAQQRDAAQKTIDFMYAQIRAGEGQLYVLEEQIDLQKRFIESKKSDAQLDQETLKILQARLKSLQDINVAEKEAIGIIEAKRQQIEDLQDKIEKTQASGDLGTAGTLIMALKKAQAELDILLGKDKQKRKKTANEIQEYLAYLSDLELFQTKKTLEETAAQRKKYAQIEKENASRSFELWLYFDDLKREKMAETAAEEIRILEEMAIHEMEIREEIGNSVINNTNNIIQSELQREVDAYSERIHNLKNFYDEQQLLAGDNKRAKDQLKLQEERELQTLERRRADREKKAAQAGILVNTALAIIKIFAGEGTYVDKLIRAGIMAGEGATQYTIASRARYYAKGELNIKGPGSETSDSIPAMLSKGESIMTAKQTREAFGILTDVRAGKLNDRVLKQLVTNGGSQMVMDDSRIVDAIKGQPKPPDLVRSGRQIYEVYTDQQNNKRFIRSKSI